RRRRGRRGPETGRRRDVGRFHGPCLRPDLQPGGEDVVHVRRPGEAAVDDPGRDGLRARRRRAALRNPVCRLHAPARAEGRGAVDAVRREGPAARVDLRHGPVMFFEHLKLYVAKGPVPEEAYRIPLGVAEVRRAGSDVTIVAISAMVERALEAAELLAASGTSAEVIDPRTLSPLDVETIVTSVEKTGAPVVV